MKFHLGRLRGFGHRLMDVLGMYRMSGKFHVLALNYLFLMFYTTLESVFVNTLLYRAFDGDMKAVILYRGITYMASSLGMLTSAYVAQKKTPVAALRMGAVFYLAMYLCLFVGMNHMRQFLFPVAVLSGLGGGFYYNGHYILLPHYADKGNRDVGVSILGVIQGVMTLSVPVVSGFVISFMPEITGYRVMFFIAMLTVGTQLYFSFRLAPVEQKRHKSEMPLALKLLAKKRSYKLTMGFEFCRGMRDGTFAFLLNMLLFEIITDEGIIGVNTFLTGALAIIGSWAYGRLVNIKNRVKYSAVTMAVLMGICSVLLVKANAASLMIFASLNAFLQVFIIYSYSNTFFDVISVNEVARSCSAETLAMREISATLGRLLGLAVTWRVATQGGTGQGYVLVMLALTAAQFAGIGFMKGVASILDRKRNREGTPLLTAGG